MFLQLAKFLLLGDFVEKIQIGKKRMRFAPSFEYEFFILYRHNSKENYLLSLLSYGSTLSLFSFDLTLQSWSPSITQTEKGRVKNDLAEVGWTSIELDRGDKHHGEVAAGGRER